MILSVMPMDSFKLYYLIRKSLGFSIGVTNIDLIVCIF
jgi:hypothetical protein